MQDNLSGKIVKRLRNNKGFTLVEVLIAMFLISIMAVGLIHGTTIALNTVARNREKTRAVAVANEKIEIIKAMDFEDIELTSENAGWELSYPELSEDGYNIYYYSTWSDDVEDSYKQIMVSVNTADMRESVEVVTRIYPSPGNAPETQPGSPAPVNLEIISDSGYGENREILLAWEEPQTEFVIDSYNVYRNGELIYNSPVVTYTDYPASNEEQVYYVTAVYEDAVESNPSNSAVATVEPYYPSPQDLAIDGYTGSGSTREVLLSWNTPDHPYDIIEYRIYRDGLMIGTSQDESFQDLIGNEDYVYYITVFYSGDVESDPSGTVETEPEDPE
jgi:prepilin-type N-terminal cleavage/methylation domain-containing protein